MTIVSAFCDDSAIAPCFWIALPFSFLGTARSVKIFGTTDCCFQAFLFLISHHRLLSNRAKITRHFACGQNTRLKSAMFDAQRTSLEHLHPNRTSPHQRQHAHAVLLSADGYRVEQLAGILRGDRDTDNACFMLGKKKELEGLADNAKPRRRKVDATQGYTFSRLLGV